MDTLEGAVVRHQTDEQRSISIDLTPHTAGFKAFFDQYKIERPSVCLLNTLPGYVLSVAEEHYSCVVCRSKPDGQSSPCPLCTSKLNLMIEPAVFANKSHVSYSIRTVDTEYIAGVDGPLDDLWWYGGKKCSGWDPGHGQKIDDSSVIRESLTVDNARSDGAYLSQTRLTKRKLAVNRKRDEDGDGRSRKRHHSDAKKLLFACPFFKNDPDQHGSCRNRKFKKMSKLEAHILHRHTFGDYYCAICYEEFPDAATWTSHCRNPMCQPQEAPARIFADDFHSFFQGLISLRQTQTQMWFAIWDWIFPGVDRPESPFIS
ncbi:unnamed protein product [Clonostachys rosea]|uniref:C2H2-type domain-containing protein n=1 Tax=Bionectria ochroleuca TaxID=29856 RepID=A0ABY6USK0_BIOOC|nr:unnamed protein product [Clonostachys rosea]